MTISPSRSAGGTRKGWGMSENLYHPPHVAAALDRVDGMNAEELRAAIIVTDRRAANFLPNEVLVRLIRRSRADGDRLAEHHAVSALAKRLSAWSWRKYSGLNREGREDVVQAVGLAISRDIARHSDIDFWEINFAQKRDRAAADAYQEYFAQGFAAEHVEFEPEAHVGGDEGEQANEIADEVLLQVFAAKFLTPEEMTYFHGLFLSDMPLSSPRASMDLVRRFGKPEGTLREIKTAIKGKLKNAWKDMSR